MVNYNPCGSFLGMLFTILFFIIGIVLIIGTYRRWMWLVDPPEKYWLWYSHSLSKENIWKDFSYILQLYFRNLFYIIRYYGLLEYNKKLELIVILITSQFGLITDY
jgi:hypothetical protein